VLWSVLITFLTIRLADWEKPLQFLILFIIVATAGFLTHYHFSLPLAGCMLFLLIKFGRGHFFRFLIISGGVVSSVILFVIIHPEFYTSFQNQPSGVGSFTWSGFVDRWVRTAFSFGPYRFKDAINAFYDLFSIMAVGIYVLLIILAIFLLKFCRKNKISILNYFRNTDPRLKFVTLLFFGLTATVITLYLTFLSPYHAMGGRYLALAWPFIGFALLWILRLFPQKSRRVSRALCVVMVLLSYSFVIAEIVYARHRSLVEPDVWQIDNAPNVIIDNVNRGVLPRLIRHVPGETEVFIARQEDLIAHPELWNSRLQTGSLYISQLSYDSDAEGREKILAIIRQSHQVRRLPRRLGGLGEVYIISN